MNLFLRFSLLVSVFLAVPFVLMYWHTDGTQSKEWTLQRLPELIAVMARVRDQERELTFRLQTCLHEIEQKREIIRELAAGKLSLGQSARRVLDLYGPQEVTRRIEIKLIPGSSPQERLGHFLIAMVEEAFDQDISGWNQSKTRLEEELQQSLREGLLPAF